MVAYSQSTPLAYYLLLMFENHCLSTAGATVAADSTSSGNLVASSVTLPTLDTAWRSGALNFGAKWFNLTTSLRFRFGTARALDAVTIHRHNVRVPWRVALFRSSDGAYRTDEEPVATSGWTDPIIRARPSDWATFSEMPFSLGPRQAVLDDLQARFRLDSLITFDEVLWNVRSMRIDFDLTAQRNGVEGVDFLQVGLVMAGRAFRPRVNFELGWSLGVNDTSELTRAESGALLGRYRARLRSLAFTLGYVDRDEAFEDLFYDLAVGGGKLARIFAWPEPHQRRYFYQTAMLCTATALPAFAMANLEYPAARGFQLEETE